MGSKGGHSPVKIKKVKKDFAVFDIHVKLISKASFSPTILSRNASLVGKNLLLVCPKNKTKILKICKGKKFWTHFFLLYHLLTIC